MNPGKLREVFTEMRSRRCTALAVDGRLTPNQQRAIEELWVASQPGRSPIKILDRSALLLSILARQAVTSEQQMQVECAQLLYYLPRVTPYLTKLLHLARRSCRCRCLLGPCGVPLETDVRVMRRRLSFLKEELKSLRQQRATQRENRRKTGAPVVALVGYPGCGKSTLFSSLTQYDSVRKSSESFETMSPVARRVLPKAILDRSLRCQGTEFILVDTMGLVEELPTELKDAFAANIEDELLNADVLLHVCDVSHPHFRKRQTAILQLLSTLGCGEKALVTVFNERTRPVNMKIAGARKCIMFPHVDCHSGVQDTHIHELVATLQGSFAGQMEELDVVLPYFCASTWTYLNTIFRLGGLLDILYEDIGVRVRGRVPKKLFCEIKRTNIQKEDLEFSSAQSQYRVLHSEWKPRPLFFHTRRRRQLVDAA